MVICYTLFIMNSFTFNPLVNILTQNKLVGSNYVGWKRNQDIVLTTSGYKYVLTKPPLDEPVPDAPQEEKDHYAKWAKDDEMARCYIQASMSSVLQHQHQSYKTSYDIISNLKEMFVDQGRPAKQAAMRVLISTKMAEGTPVQDHMLKMMDSLMS